MKLIHQADGQLVICAESKKDILVILGLIGEAPKVSDDDEVDFRDAIHQAHDHWLHLEKQASLFDADSKPETVRATASVPAQLAASGYDFSPSAVEWAMDRTTAEVTEEWDAGYGSGWRGDELVTEKSAMYLFAYEQGKVGRQAYDERYPSVEGDRG